MANDYMNQHKMMAMGMAVSGQKMVNGGPKKGMVEGTKGVKGDPKAMQLMRHMLVHRHDQQNPLGHEIDVI